MKQYTNFYQQEINLCQKCKGFTQSACGPFTRGKQRINVFKETGYSRYIHRNKFYEACFQHEMAYGDFKDLNRRTAADKV